MVTAGKVGFADVQKAFENMTSEGGSLQTWCSGSRQDVGLKANLQDVVDMAMNDLSKVAGSDANAWRHYKPCRELWRNRQGDSWAYTA